MRDLIPMDKKYLADTEPPQRGGVLNPLANKKILFLLLVFFIFSCQSEPKSKSTNIETANVESTNLETTKPETTKIEPEKNTKIIYYTVNFIAAGDNLFHESLLNSHLKNGVYDFSPIYTEIKSIIQSADLAFINQETPMAGEKFGYSGYPAFNSPQSLAKTHLDTGFDIVNLANNHAMDKGASGLYATLDYLNSIEEFTVIGARKEGPSARIITKNNITFGFLSYTYGLNGNTLPKDNPNLVSLINRKKIEEEVVSLRPLCDFLVVSMHWGDEYMLQPNKEQIDLAAFLANLNVDLIIGHHPHVLQRVETIKRPDEKETICYYSLGNFISHQRERERIIGALLALTFVKQSTGELSIINYGIIPVITHYDKAFSNTKIYPLYSYTDELLNKHGLKNFEGGLSFDFFNGVTDRLNAEIFKVAPFTGK